MKLFDLFKKPEINQTDETRRQNLLRHGRITEGTIIETEINEDGAEIAHYYYQIQGVDFESADILTDEQLKTPLKFAPGAKVSVKFNPQNHGNSILV